METELHAAIVDLVPVLQLAPSKWNQTRGADKAMLRFATKKEELDLDLLGEEASAKSPFDAVRCLQQPHVPYAKAALTPLP
eukprot:6176376-Pleurochrysis_carterae.AAC.1